MDYEYMKSAKGIRPLALFAYSRLLLFPLFIVESPQFLHLVEEQVVASQERFENG